MTSTLFSPIRLADVTLDNRIVVSPMCQYSADDGVATDWHATHLGMLANSGAGLLIVEATHVERHGRITHGCLGLYSDACEAALGAHHRPLPPNRHAPRSASSSPMPAAKARRSGRGRAARRSAPDEDPWPTIAPSALPFGAGWHTPRAMTEDDMTRVRKAFADAAARSVRIGFDAIELHLAHGYLLHSFLSPIANKRNDGWGGSLDGRMRYPLDVARAVRAVVPRGMALGARITGSDWTEGGLTAQDAVVFAKALKDAGLDYIDVSSGGITRRYPKSDRARLQRSAGAADTRRALVSRCAPSA